MILKAARKLLIGSAITGVMVSSFAFSATAQDSDPADVYAKLLQQIADVQASTDQKRLYLQVQEQEIESLRSQIASTDELKASVKPLVVKMTADIEKEMNKDVPFNPEERFNRLDKLKEDLASPDAPIGSLFRQAMNIYDIEVVAGASIASYNGNHPKTPGLRLAACDADLEGTACDLPKEVREALPRGATKIEDENLRENINDGYYVHFGRMALIYLQYDSSEGWRWDRDSNDWVELSTGDLLDARRAVRIARGESAPGVVLAPIRVAG